MTEADNGDKRKSLVSVSQVGWLVCERPEAKQSGCTVEAKRHQTTPPPVPMPATAAAWLCNVMPMLPTVLPHNYTCCP